MLKTETDAAAAMPVSKSACFGGNMHQMQRREEANKKNLQSTHLESPNDHPFTSFWSSEVQIFPRAAPFLAHVHQGASGTGFSSSVCPSSVQVVWKKERFAFIWGPTLILMDSIGLVGPYRTTNDGRWTNCGSSLDYPPTHSDGSGNPPVCKGKWSCKGPCSDSMLVSQLLGSFFGLCGT